jgi:hypothetical protein
MDVAGRNYFGILTVEDVVRFDIPDSALSARGGSPAGVPSGLSPFLCFKLLDECSEMRGDGRRQGVVLVFEALPNC